MQASTAILTLTGLAPYSQSRQHEDPFLDGESHSAYDLRTWRSHMHVDTRDGKPTVVLPAPAIHQAIVGAAKYSKEKIKGQGSATWTAKFTSGLALFEDPSLNINPDTVKSITLSCNSDGVRGSGKRVLRTFPIMPTWSTTFEIKILDPIIVEKIFREMVEKAGMFIGLGRSRPEKLGMNGRFALTKLVWEDNRELVWKTEQKLAA